MIRPTLYQQFEEQLKAVLESKGKLCLPNVKEVEDPSKALLAIACTRPYMPSPYYMRIRNFDPPEGVVTHQTAYYARIFTNHEGMGGRFDGSGVILTADAGKAHAYTFQMCEHEWDESGANHNRGWHPKRCTKCGFDASIDSGD